MSGERNDVIPTTTRPQAGAHGCRLAHVAEKGRKGFTLSEVARRAGVSVAAPYRHCGKERSLPEFDALLAAAGLRRTSRVPTANSPQRVIEAVAA